MIVYKIKLFIKEVNKALIEIRDLGYGPKS